MVTKLSYITIRSQIYQCHSYPSNVNCSTAGATYGHIYLHFIKFNKWKMVHCNICGLERWQLELRDFHGLVNGTWRIWTSARSEFRYWASNRKLLSFDWFDRFWWCFFWLCYSNKTFKGGILEGPSKFVTVFWRLRNKIKYCVQWNYKCCADCKQLWILSQLPSRRSQKLQI